MLDYFLEFFTQTAVQFVGLIVPVFAIWLLVDLISSLLFKD